jgi:hypothetical protein
LCVVRDADAAGLCDPFKPCRNVNAVAEDVVIVEDDVTDVNANAEFDPDIPRHTRVLTGHAALYLHRATRCIDGTGELSQHAVAGGLYDAASMQCDFGIDKRLPKRLELGERTFFVSAHQKAIAGNIRRQYSRQSPLYALAAQGAPPGSGKLNVHIAQLWADGPKWVKGRRTHGEHNKSASPLGADHTADVAPGRLRAKSGSSLLGERAILPEVAVDEK